MFISILKIVGGIVSFGLGLLVFVYTMAKMTEGGYVGSMSILEKNFWEGFFKFCPHIALMSALMMFSFELIFPAKMGIFSTF